MPKLTATFDNARMWAEVQVGDSIAFQRLVETYYPKLFSYGTKHTKDEELVKDCIQDVFVEVWSRRKKLGKIESVQAYLLKSLYRRICREKVRNRFKLVEEFDEDTPFDVEFSFETQLITREIEQDHIRQLTHLLNQLPKRQKEVIYLRYYQQLDYPEIAKLMGLSRQTVYNHMNDAISKLRHFWQESLLVLALCLLYS